jgi:8-oxo-dGTP diphosphatase
MTNQTLVADPAIERQNDGLRSITEVAVGVLVRPDGHFLLTSRPADKVYAGYWEFPGGKLEPGESVAQALHRELYEEIGIAVQSAVPWKVEIVDYPHALVRLNFYKVLEWTGQLQMREAQAFTWQCLPVQVQPVLPGTIPVLQWLADERKFTSATHLTAIG